MEPQKVLRGDEVLQWMRWGDRDYIGARQLLIAGRLVQGASLATTSVEKYLKARLALLDSRVARSHDVSILYGHLLGAGSNLRLDGRFLAYLNRAYELRYPDSLPKGFNIALNQVVLLTRLDRTIFSLLVGLKLSNSKGDIPLILELSSKLNDRRVLDGNVALRQISDRDLRSKQPIVGLSQVRQRCGSRT
jgi:HEPN domain-containing protein